MKRLAIVVLSLVAVINARAQSPTLPRVYVFAATERDGFTLPTTKDLTDSVKSVKKTLKKHATLVDAAASADVTLEILSRDTGVVKARLTAGSFTTDLTGTNTVYGKVGFLSAKSADTDLGNQVNDWLKANQTRLANRAK